MDEEKKYHVCLVKNAVIAAILILSLIAVIQSPSVNAQNAGSKTNVPGTVPTIPKSTALSGSPNLEPFANFTKASFVQAGIGLRNVGSGHISLHVPADAYILKAYLYWAHLGLPSNKIYLDGEQITG